MGTVSKASETVPTASGTAAGSTATPTSASYLFDYWTCDNGTDHISTEATYTPSKNASGAYETHTYYAHFRENKVDITVHHYLKGTTTEVASDVTATQIVGSDYTAAPVTTYQEKDLTVDSYNPSQKITVATEGNVITIYYTLPLKIEAETDSKTYDGKSLKVNIRLQVH